MLGVGGGGVGRSVWGVGGVWSMGGGREKRGFWWGGHVWAGGGARAGGVWVGREGAGARACAGKGRLTLGGRSASAAGGRTLRPAAVAPNAFPNDRRVIGGFSAVDELTSSTVVSSVSVLGIIV